MSPVASPALRCRRRRLSATLAVVPILGFALAAGAAAPCAAPGDGWCVARRFPGSVEHGELGFRFGEPLDVDGDRHADVAAGARFKPQKRTLLNGAAAVWSGRTGAAIRAWDGEWPDGFFGHWVLPVPDVSGDGLADLVIAAPHGSVDDGKRGVVVARSPKTGAELWRRLESESENLGWDMALAGDHDGDGHPDLYVGAPGGDTGIVRLLSGRNGTVIRTYAPPQATRSFGWYVASLDDVDGDARPDLAVGAPFAEDADGTMVGAAWLVSSATGRVLQHWRGTDRRGGFGGIVAVASDLDDDDRRDVAIGAPGTEDAARSLPGEVVVYSSATGRELRRWSGSQPGELFGRMIAAAGDLDGDGVDDVAVSAPWHRRGTADRVGRVELRSSRSGAVLAELFGDEADCWFGWHVRRAPDPDGRGRPALLIGSLRHPVGGKPGVGVVDVYVHRRAGGGNDQGTITRDARRSDIR